MSARFQFGAYLLKADDGGGWVVGVPIMQKTKNRAGEEVEVERILNPWYPSTLPNALARLLEMKIHDSDATTMGEVRDMILSFREEVAELFEVNT